LLKDFRFVQHPREQYRVATQDDPMPMATHVGEISRPARWLGRAAGPSLIFAFVVLSIIVINPLREIVAVDDSWAYARMVQHLLATGRYQLDIWSAPNMPVQIYLAAGLSKIFGYSLSLLRCSTLALLIIGLFSFYALLRELSCSKQTASVFTMALLASPLTLILGFTFMTDVPFLSWLLLSLWLYVRALRHHDIKSMLLGSIAAGCAIGTRQFGLALVGGLILCWLATGREHRPAFRLVAAGFAVPLLAAGLQIQLGLTAPNITQAVKLAQQHDFLNQPAVMLAKELFWRCALILQYTGMAMLPVLPFAICAWRSARQSRERPVIATVTILSGIAIIAALSMSSFLTARPAARHHGIWEPLELHWLLPAQLERERSIMRFLDLAGIVGGAVLVGTCSKEILRAWHSRQRSAEWTFLAGTAIGLFALHLVFVQLNDTYTTAFIPFGLLALAKGEREGDHNRPPVVWSAVISATLIVVMSLYVRSEDSALNALWKGADALVDTGVRPDNIAAPLAWEEYHGAFDQWVSAGTPGLTDPGTIGRGNDSFHDPFYEWLRRRDDKVDYHVGLYPHPPSEWNTISAYGYRSMFFHQRFAWVLKRRTAH
jgi:hypothetical protein